MAQQLQVTRGATADMLAMPLGCGPAPYIARTRGFLAHIRHSAHVVSVHVANVRPYSSFTATTAMCYSVLVEHALPFGTVRTLQAAPSTG